MLESLIEANNRKKKPNNQTRDVCVAPSMTRSLTLCHEQGRPDPHLRQLSQPVVPHLLRHPVTQAAARCVRWFAFTVNSILFRSTASPCSVPSPQDGLVQLK